MKLIRKIKGNQKGLTLTEVLMALAIFAIVGISVMFALNASNRTIVHAHELTIAESLTRTTIEYVKRAPYDSLSPSYVSPVDLNADPYFGDYEVVVDIYRPDPEDDGFDDDDGIQKITVNISYGSKQLLTTTAYKVDR